MNKKFKRILGLGLCLASVGTLAACSAPAIADSDNLTLLKQEHAEYKDKNSKLELNVADLNSQILELEDLVNSMSGDWSVEDNSESYIVNYQGLDRYNFNFVKTVEGNEVRYETDLYPSLGWKEYVDGNLREYQTYYIFPRLNSGEQGIVVSKTYEVIQPITGTYSGTISSNENYKIDVKSFNYKADERFQNMGYPTFSYFQPEHANFSSLDTTTGTSVSHGQSIFLNQGNDEIFLCDATGITPESLEQKESTIFFLELFGYAHFYDVVGNEHGLPATTYIVLEIQ